MVLNISGLLNVFLSEFYSTFSTRPMSLSIALYLYIFNYELPISAIVSVTGIYEDSYIPICYTFHPYFVNKEYFSIICFSFPYHAITYNDFITLVVVVKVSIQLGNSDR